MKRIHVTFPGGDIELEGVWHLPEAENQLPAVIVCHPHPLYGGNMSNNVVFGICQALAQKGIAALRFNFRGVHNSDGEYGNGIGEQDDIRAALAFTLSTPNINTKKLGLAGYSFGGGIALSVAVQNEEFKRLALVSPALSDAGWEQLKTYCKPFFLISGQQDSIIPPEQIRQYLNDMTVSGRIEVIPGTDHFWEGYEAEVTGRVSEFFVDGFG